MNEAATEYLTIRELATLLDCHPRTVGVALRAGKLAGAYKETTPFGEVWRVPARFADRGAWEAAVGLPGYHRSTTHATT